jgi:hypothetical protein
MTATRWYDQQAPLVVETPALPVTLSLLSGMTKRRLPRSDVYLEMRSPSGRLYIVTSDNGIERSHLDDIYVATCLFDSFGSWDLRWHGLSDDEREPPVPMRVEVIQIDPLVNTGEVC